MARYIRLEQVESTNTYLLAVAHELPSGTVVYTPCQTAGRGQKGNRWLAEPGMNATFSYLYKHASIVAREQFCISEAAALAVAGVLNELTSKPITVKWPNDIYHGDCKICGMLIESSLDGRRVGHSVIGIGINVNQCEFDPYAPNPTSLALVTGGKHDVDQVMRRVCDRMEQLLARVEREGTPRCIMTICQCFIGMTDSSIRSCCPMAQSLQQPSSMWPLTACWLCVMPAMAPSTTMPSSRWRL